MKKRKILNLLIALALTLSFAGCDEGDNSSPNTSTANTQTSAPDKSKDETPPKQPEAPKQKDLEVIEHHGDGQYVKGKIKNNSGRKYSYVQVEINLYDKDGNQLDSTMSNVTNLEAGATWNFEAPILRDGVAKYKIADISGS